ncbi:hypothetical protein [Algiphilus sp.]|uniref:hypothetical protein n=1 Tax=Algiphilus sp. TaxID=1872431 RepID=UPI0025BA8203|nr:hypothetical protein [Algiphilus sp.]MCK5769843.1 hypothetical protein [Algiphilus sp.]
MFRTLMLSSAMLAGALAAAPALAGGSATIASEGNSMTMEYRGDMVRMGAPGEADGYTIIRDERMYTVTGGTVIDATSMMKAFASAATPQPSETVARFHGLESTGRSETVAGISGEVYMLDFTDSDGRRQQKEVVLSSDARVRDLQSAFMNMTRTMAKATDIDMQGADDYADALGNRGVLRMGNEMRVTEISGSAPSAARFELPSEPQRMDGDGGLGAAISGFFGDKADRQADRASDRTEQEVDQQTDKAVDNALDKAFDKLFGN